ncbi:hypothetical protein CAPGI0001_0556 [Capnocytophaga gingivalis ATCC 33624]|nr:hypothetical protein CAPGI0001_0556 [Capnocytophaga gingivalis ATCC 33624]
MHIFDIYLLIWQKYNLFLNLLTILLPFSIKIITFALY